MASGGDPGAGDGGGPRAFHGGAFFDAIGDTFDDLTRRHGIVNADVLDAWFPPSPRIAAAIAPHLEWLLATSPPTSCEGLLRTIAAARGVPEASVLPGAGSSELIFLALRHWLRPGSRALVLDPSYGEYAHVLGHVVGCRVDRFPLGRDEGYEPDAARLRDALARGYDFVVIVNPNSPTGVHMPRADLVEVLRAASPATRFWIDETYVEYAGPGATLEPVAAASQNMFVCKSMSKAYALSGARVAYLVGPAGEIAALRGITPPWAVGLIAQVAAVEALRDGAYYDARWRETHALRAALASSLASVLGAEVVPGCANFILFHLPPGAPSAPEVARRCRERGVYVRDFPEMARLGPSALRVAVKDAGGNAKIVAALAASLA